jgi:hypothetical protein
MTRSVALAVALGLAAPAGSRAADDSAQANTAAEEKRSGPQSEARDMERGSQAGMERAVNAEDASKGTASKKRAGKGSRQTRPPKKERSGEPKGGAQEKTK